jgi:branched-chain amino acid transport system ATP-binding protein
VLSIKNLDCYYDDFQALRDVHLDVAEGDIVALLGPNAAGKTTLLSAVSGMIEYAKGDILFEGVQISDIKPEKVVDLGLAHVPEGRRLFGTLTVLENLEMGAYGSKARRFLRKNLRAAYELFPVLKERATQKAGSLSGGEQQMCAIARGLMAQPRLLMIDEMSLGLSPLMVKHMFQMVREVAQSGVTILLVEQQVHHTLEIAGSAYIMENGHIALAGPTKEISGNEHVRKAYLGM